MRPGAWPSGGGNIHEPVAAGAPRPRSMGISGLLRSLAAWSPPWSEGFLRPQRWPYAR